MGTLNFLIFVILVYFFYFVKFTHTSLEVSTEYEERQKSRCLNYKQCLMLTKIGHAGDRCLLSLLIQLLQLAKLSQLCLCITELSP